jgi:hypothetical protein
MRLWVQILLGPLLSIWLTTESDFDDIKNNISAEATLTEQVITIAATSILY